MQRFFKSDSVHGNVVLNFSRSLVCDLCAFAQGYHSAGKRLAEQMRSSRGYHEYDGYPIVFLYRHALEL